VAPRHHASTLDRDDDLGKAVVLFEVVGSGLLARVALVKDSREVKLVKAGPDTGTSELARSMARITAARPLIARIPSLMVKTV
jgi:hypothetical protein